MRRAVIVAFMLCASTVAHADQPPVAVTLADVLAATAKAPASQVTRHEIQAADALVEAARAWPDPSLRVETNRLTARLVAGVSVPLPVFGTVGAARRVAAAQALTVRSEAILFDRDVRRRAVAAWIALARVDGEIAATEIAATQAADLERVALGRLEAGVGADVDVTAARAARARADLAASTAKRSHQAAAAELAGLLGWDPMAPVISAGDLPGRASVSIEELRARLPAHPDRTLAQRKIAVADATVQEVRKLRLPGVAVEAQVSAFDPTTPGTDALVALSLSLPLFARTDDRARSARATAAAERARLAVTETQLAGGLIAAYRRWQSAAETLAALETDIVPAQERAATLTRQAYQEGARDLASALQADRDLTAVRAEVITARADVASAWAALLDAAGDDLGGLGAK